MYVFYLFFELTLGFPALLKIKENQKIKLIFFQSRNLSEMLQFREFDRLKRKSGQSVLYCV